MTLRPCLHSPNNVKNILQTQTWLSCIVLLGIPSFLGILLFTVLSGVAPFQAYPHFQAYRRTVNLEYRNRTSYSQNDPVKFGGKINAELNHPRWPSLRGT